MPRPVLATLAAALLSACLAGGAWAQAEVGAEAGATQVRCDGVNLLDTMAEADRRALIAATDAVPYPRGHLWRATRGDAVVHLVGTYHLDDPRHAATMARITPLLDAATTVMVEAGPLEEAALMADLARDPSLMVNTDGPTLREALTDPEWQLLADAMRARGMPPFMVSKFRPWYVSMLLALPACDLDSLAQSKGGLDGMVIDYAQTQGKPIQALESHNTVFRLFEGMPMEEQLGMIRSSLALEPYAADYAVTLADAYFAGESRLIWELTRQMTLKMPGQNIAQVEADFAKMEQVLMTDRNRAWIPVIEAAAKDGPVVAAFGALHLPGETGVLRLMEQAGFTLEQLPM
jgi:uncharacterized protein YbaP (TraB family)